MQFQVSCISRDECSAQEWDARVDLAAAHRLAVMHGLHEGIFNHLTQVVPGKPDRYYQIPFGMHWSVVKASSFMEVGIDDGEVKRGEGDVERSCYCIHAPIHKALPQAKAVFHTHMPFASALTRLEDPHIKEIGQTEVGMMEMIAYDDNYTGPAFDPAEGERLAKVLGNKTVLFMANHGVTTVGQSVADSAGALLLAAFEPKRSFGGFGTVRVACSNGARAALEWARMMSGPGATNSAACVRMASASPRPHR